MHTGPCAEGAGRRWPAFNLSRRSVVVCARRTPGRIGNAQWLLLLLLPLLPVIAVGAWLISGRLASSSLGPDRGLAPAASAPAWPDPQEALGTAAESASAPPLAAAMRLPSIFVTHGGEQLSAWCQVLACLSRSQVPGILCPSPALRSAQAAGCPLFYQSI